MNATIQRLIEADEQIEEFRAFVRLYLQTYINTQTHPTPAQEATCMNMATKLLA